MVGDEVCFQRTTSMKYNNLHYNMSNSCSQRSNVCIPFEWGETRNSF